jgi:hypothetical protein
MVKKLLLMACLFSVSEITIAQKHAPRPKQQKKYVPGIYPEASQRMLKFSDVSGLTSWDLKVMRNEIFARHGYIFKTQDMLDYFSQQTWYRPLYEDVQYMLTVVEKKNLEFIKSYE